MSKRLNVDLNGQWPNPVEQLREVIEAEIVLDDRQLAEGIAVGLDSMGYVPDLRRVATTNGIRCVVRCNAPFGDVVEACKHAYSGRVPA